MPNTRSAAKELRKAKKRTAANNQVKDAYKQAVKGVKKQLAAGSLNDQLTTLLSGGNYNNNHLKAKVKLQYT